MKLEDFLLKAIKSKDSKERYNVINCMVEVGEYIFIDALEKAKKKEKIVPLISTYESAIRQLELMNIDNQ